MRNALAVLVCLATAFVGIPATPSRGQGLPATPSGPATEATVRAILADRVDKNHSSLGIAVGMIGPEGRLLVTHGATSADRGRPIQGDTLFEIGSVTKVFTALLLADLVGRGDVRLQDPVRAHLPPGVTMRAVAGPDVTLADLATHTAGMPFWPPNVPAGADTMRALAQYSVDDLMTFLSTFEPPAEASRRWAYSNTDMGLLGHLLARRASTTFEGLLAQRVTRPLGLADTALTLTPRQRDRLATGHTAQLKPAAAWDAPTFAAAGSLHSSVNDLLTWLASFAADGSLGARHLSLMRQTARPGPGFTQKLGWMSISTGPGDELLFHDGATLGYASAIAYDPATRRGVVVLSNSATPVGDIARHLLRSSIPLVQAEPAPQRTEVTLSPAVLQRYAGAYEPGPGVQFVVTHEGEALMLQLPGLPKFRIRPESERTFFVAENPRLSVVFEVDDAGRTVRLRLAAPTGDVAAARTRD